MNDILKQRLVGALILVALGVVFWPIIFVEPGTSIAREDLQIPARPLIDTQPIAAPAQGDIRVPPKFEARELEARQPSEQSVEPAPSLVEPSPMSVELEKPESVPVVTEEPAAIISPKTRTEAPVTPTLDAQGVPVAWILRVASVSSAEKAEQLRLRLLALDKKAYVQRVRREGGDLYRVYIGPKFEKALLEGMQAKVNSEFGVESMVTRYIP